MSSAGYSSVSNDGQGSFHNPRQKTWGVFQLITTSSENISTTGLQLILITTNFIEVKDKVRAILNAGGISAGIDNIIVTEIVPIDTVITPSV